MSPSKQPSPSSPRVYTHYHTQKKKSHIVIYNKFSYIRGRATCEPWSNIVLDVSSSARRHGRGNESSLNTTTPLAFLAFFATNFLQALACSFHLPRPCVAHTISLCCAVCISRPSIIAKPFSCPVVILQREGQGEIERELRSHGHGE